jgi:hypothetical protein
VGVGVGVEDGVGVGVKIGWATVGMMQGPVLAPPVLLALPARGALPGAFVPGVPLTGVGTTLGLFATVGVTAELQGWFGNPPTPEGLVVPDALCPVDAP